MRKMMVVGVFLTTLTWGCVRARYAPQPVGVMLPNGAAGAVVFCQAKSECYQLSSQVCKGGYTILQASEKPANDFTSSDQDVEYIIQCSPTKETRVAQD